MRCKYCHNRDTWDLNGGKIVTVDEIMADLISYRHFITASGGGITCSGGEALLQPEFIRDLFKAAQAEGIHTCLDTNGHIRKHTDVIDEVLEHTDLVLLDIKQMKDEIHQDLVGVSNKRTLQFANYLAKLGQKTWVRYVVVPGYTDDEGSAELLGQFIENMTNIEKVELLPYHKLGAHKWKALGYDYPLEGVNPPSKDVMDTMVRILSKYHNNVIY